MRSRRTAFALAAAGVAWRCGGNRRRRRRAQTLIGNSGMRALAGAAGRGGGCTHQRNGAGAVRQSAARDRQDRRGPRRLRPRRASRPSRRRRPGTQHGRHAEPRFPARLTGVLYFLTPTPRSTGRGRCASEATTRPGLRCLPRHSSRGAWRPRRRPCALPSIATCTRPKCTTRISTRFSACTGATTPRACVCGGGAGRSCFPCRITNRRFGRRGFLQGGSAGGGGAGRFSVGAAAGYGRRARGMASPRTAVVDAC